MIEVLTVVGILKVFQNIFGVQDTKSATNVVRVAKWVNTWETWSRQQCCHHNASSFYRPPYREEFRNVDGEGWWTWYWSQKKLSKQIGPGESFYLEHCESGLPEKKIVGWGRKRCARVECSCAVSQRKEATRSRSKRITWMRSVLLPERSRSEGRNVLPAHSSAPEGRTDFSEWFSSCATFLLNFALGSFGHSTLHSVTNNNGNHKPYLKARIWNNKCAEKKYRRDLKYLNIRIGRRIILQKM